MVPRKRRMNWTPSRVRILREHYGESQPAFAARLGFAVSSLRNWEQVARKKPVPRYVARMLDLLQLLAERDLIQPNPDPRYRLPAKPGR